MRYNLPKINLILIAVSFLIIVIGFALMVGEPSGATYNPDIFSVRRIHVGPMMALFGFVMERAQYAMHLLYSEKKK